MEILAKSLSEKIAIKLHFGSEKREVIAYGLTAIFQMVAIFVITSVVGIIGGFWYECMVLFIGVGLLRKSVGGAHSQTFTGCLFISILTITFLAFLSRFLSRFLFLNSAENPAVWIIVSAFFTIAFIYTYLKAPVDSGNKPIQRPEKIKRLRRNAFLTLFLFFITALLLLYFSYKNGRLISVSISFAFAALWQTFVLTVFGQGFINAVDRKFNVKE